MQTIGATHLNIFYFIISTIRKGTLSGRIVSAFFWLLLPFAYGLMIYSLYAAFAPLKGMIAIIFLLVLSTNRILVISIVEIMVRQQKIYSYLPADNLIKSTFIDSIFFGALDFAIISLISLHHHSGLGADITILVGQKILLFAVSGISYSIIKIALLILNRKTANTSLRSGLIINKFPKLETIFSVWKINWFNFNMIIPLLFVFLGGFFASIYFHSAQFIIPAFAIIILSIQASIYSHRVSDLAEVFALKITPFKMLKHDYIRLLIWQIGLIILSVIIALIDNEWKFAAISIGGIFASAYLLFAWGLYCNRFGPILGGGAMTGEILVLAIVTVTLLPILPLFMAGFLYFNFRKQPKGFYATA